MPEDFSHKDLRGKSFKGQDLTGANFKGADIRGVSFKGATLVEVDFSNAHAGLRDQSHFIWLIISLILFFFAGILWAFSGYFFYTIVDNKEVLQEGIDRTTQALFITIVSFLLLLITGLIAIRKRQFSKWAGAWAGILAVAGAVAGAGAGALSGAVAGAVALSVVVAVALAGAVVGAMAWAVAWAVVGAMAGVGTVAWFVAEAGTWAVAVALSGAGALGILSSYIAWRTLKEDEQFAWIRTFSLSIVSWGGTNFQGANLTSTNFHSAILKNSRFNKSSIIYRTCWQEAQKLELAHVKGTILENRAVRQLLVTGKGKDNVYVGLNLKGAYLAGADLTNSDFTEADLSGATLENATLTNAHLARASVIDVEFKGANLTGSCLESWNIDRTTHFEGAHADYVYLLSNQQERRPASGSFGEEEFSKLFQEVFNTVDLIFKDGIDWQAFLYSFDTIREKVRVESDDAEISVQSIENKGDGVFVVRVNVPPEMSEKEKEEIHRGLKEKYDTQLKLIEEKYKAEIKGHIKQIEYQKEDIVYYRKENTDMRKTISRLAEVEKQHIKINAEEVITTMEYKKNETHITARDITGSTINLGEISGIVTNTINQLPSSQNLDSEGLREILEKLQKLIESADDKELKPEDKADALEEVKTLAEAGKEPLPDEKQKSSARKSLKFFKGLASELPSATKIAVELNKIIPEITKLFGF